MMPSQLDQYARDETDAFRADVKRTIRALDDALEPFPKEATQLLQAAEIGVVRVRDDLIERSRHSEWPEERTSARRDLVQANICVSLSVGMEYPQGSVKKKPLAQARQLLEELLERHL